MVWIVPGFELFVFAKRVLVLCFGDRYHPAVVAHTVVAVSSMSVVLLQRLLMAIAD